MVHKGHNFRINFTGNINFRKYFLFNNLIKMLTKKKLGRYKLVCVSNHSKLRIKLFSWKIK